MKKWLIRAGVVGLLLAIAGFYYINKPVKNLTNVKPAYQLKAAQLFEEFSDNEAAANEKYLDKVLSVEGVVKEVKSSPEEGTIIILETDDALFGVNCSFNDVSKLSSEAPEPGDHLQIKGMCTGMLMDVVLVRCSISNK